MEKVKTIINLKTIREFLKEESENFSEKELREFVEYLEIDFYDWLRSNLNSFLLDREEE
jgi:succinate dehydrogenase flavin-adding protein (antitoxin of CptAB toxin-antitoxin module)